MGKMCYLLFALIVGVFYIFLVSVMKQYADNSAVESGKYLKNNSYGILTFLALAVLMVALLEFNGTSQIRIDSFVRFFVLLVSMVIGRIAFFRDYKLLAMVMFVGIVIYVSIILGMTPQIEGTNFVVGMVVGMVSSGMKLIEKLFKGWYENE